MSTIVYDGGRSRKVKTELVRELCYGRDNDMFGETTFGETTFGENDDRGKDVVPNFPKTQISFFEING